MPTVCWSRPVVPTLPAGRPVSPVRHCRRIMHCRLLTVIDARPVNAERFGDLGTAHPRAFISRTLAASIEAGAPLAGIDSVRFGSRDTFHLALAPEIGRKHARHVEELSARRGAGVDRPFDRLEGNAALSKVGDDVSASRARDLARRSSA
jgi:hypothetical protein